jgi:hypothetical protein
MFWLGLFLGASLGFLAAALFASSRRERNGSLDDCEKCKLTMCAKCPYPADLEALEAMYNAECHARKTAKGELKAAKERLCRMLGQQQEVAR